MFSSLKDAVDSTLYSESLRNPVFLYIKRCTSTIALAFESVQVLLNLFICVCSIANVEIISRC